MNNFIDELLKEREENKKDIKNICCKEQVISFLK